METNTKISVLDEVIRSRRTIRSFYGEISDETLVNLPQQELGASLPIATLIAVALCLLFLDAQHKREFPFHPYLYTIRNSLVTRYHFSLHTSFVKKEISLLTPLPISSL